MSGAVRGHTLLLLFPLLPWDKTDLSSRNKISQQSAGHRGREPLTHCALFIKVYLFYHVFAYTATLGV